MASPGRRFVVILALGLVATAAAASDDGFLALTPNTGIAHTTGLEATFHPFDSMTFEVNGLVDPSRMLNINQAMAMPDSPALPMATNWSVGGLASYSLPLSENMSLLLRGEGDYVGQSHLTFDPVPFPASGGYVVSKFLAQLSATGWRLSGAVSNPADLEDDSNSSLVTQSGGHHARRLGSHRSRTLGLAYSAVF